MGRTNIDLRQTNIIGQGTRERIVGPQVCAALEQMRIRLAGLSDAAYGFRFVRTRPDISQILACTSGRGRVLVGGQWRDCAAGEAYLTPPGAMHAYEAVRGTRWGVCWVVYWHDAEEGLDLPAPTLVKTDAAALASTIEGLYRESVGAGEPSVMYGWVELMHVHVRRALRAAVSTAPADLVLWRLWEQVDGDLDHPWDVPTLAARVGISGEHLRRRCLATLGRSPMRHVAHLRIRRASALLASNTLPIEEIAWRVGYENAFAFSTAFKRLTGLRPSDLRRRDVKPPI